jgi:hypothetical protein
MREQCGREREWERFGQNNNTLREDGEMRVRGPSFILGKAKLPLLDAFQVSTLKQE